MADATRGAELRREMDSLKDQLQELNEKQDCSMEEIKQMFATMINASKTPSEAPLHGRKGVWREEGSMNGGHNQYSIPTHCPRIEFP